MPRYSPFSGGPAATDLSGIFAQWDTGALARGLASASEKVGNAIAERYVQTKKDKEGAALTDSIVLPGSDLGEQILEWSNLKDVAQYKGLSDSQKAKLIPAFQTRAVLAASADAITQKKKKQASERFLPVGLEGITRNLTGSTEHQSKTLDENYAAIMGVAGNLDPSVAKEITSHYLTQRENIEKQAPPTYKALTGDMEGIVEITDYSGTRQMNLPKSKEDGGADIQFANDVEKARIAYEKDPTNPTLKNNHEYMQKLALKKATLAGSMESIYDSEGNLVIHKATGTGITVSQQSEHQKYVSAMSRGVAHLDSFFHKIEPNQLGIPGQAGEVLIDNVFVDFFPEDSYIKKQANKRIDTRQAMRLWSEGVIRSVSGDTRFSVPDRTAIEAITKSPNAWVTYTAAKRSMMLIRQKFQMDSRDRLQKLGTEEKDWPLFAKTPDMIQSDYAQGTIPYYDAFSAMKIMNPLYGEWLGKSFGEVQGSYTPETMTREIEDSISLMYPVEYRKAFKQGADALKNK